MDSRVPSTIVQGSREGRNDGTDAHQGRITGSTGWRGCRVRRWPGVLAFRATRSPSTRIWRISRPGPRRVPCRREAGSSRMPGSWIHGCARIGVCRASSGIPPDGCLIVWLPGRGSLARIRRCGVGSGTGGRSIAPSRKGSWNRMLSRGRSGRFRSGQGVDRGRGTGRACIGCLIPVLEYAVRRGAAGSRV